MSYRFGLKMIYFTACLVCQINKPLATKYCSCYTKLVDLKFKHFNVLVFLTVRKLNLKEINKYKYFHDIDLYNELIGIFLKTNYKLKRWFSYFFYLLLKSNLIIIENLKRKDSVLYSYDIIVRRWCLQRGHSFNIICLKD